MAGRRVKMFAVCSSFIFAVCLAGFVFPLRGVREVENRVKNENYFDIGRAKAGEIVAESAIQWNLLELYFVSKEITDDVFVRINGKSYREDGWIALEDLRYLKVLHYNYDHEIQVGEMIVNVQIADRMCRIFRELFEAEYEIESMRLIDDYWTGDGNESDEASIQENNSSAFCYRTIAGKQTLSNHAYGLAVDINPLQNPYVVYANGVPVQYPQYSSQFVARTSKAKHVITEGDTCLEIFKKWGFQWGGDWKTVRDYQHFEWDER